MDEGIRDQIGYPLEVMRRIEEELHDAEQCSSHDKLKEHLAVACDQAIVMRQAIGGAGECGIFWGQEWESEMIACLCFGVCELLAAGAGLAMAGIHFALKKMGR